MNKKTPMLLVVIALIAVAALLYFFLRSPQKPVEDVHSVATWLPEQTLALFYLPDPQASTERFQNTAIAAIGREPSVKAFMELPLSHIPKEANGTWKDLLPKLAAIRARQLFISLAIAGPEDVEVRAGFRYSGEKEKVEELLAPVKAELKKQNPETATETHSGVVIESATMGDQVLCTAHTNGWYFITNSTAVMKNMIDVNADGLTPNLSSEPAFSKLTASLSPVVESLIYVNAGRAMAAVESFQPGVFPRDQLQDYTALIAATIFDGPLIRDEIRLLTNPDHLAPNEIQLKTRILAPSDPLVYSAWSLNLPTAEQLRAAADAGVTGPLAMLPEILPEAEWELLREGIGNEIGLLVDWEEGSAQPVFAFAFPLVEKSKAREAIVALTSRPVMGQEWTRMDTEGGEVWSVTTAMGLTTISPVIALIGDFLLVGTDRDEVIAIANTSKSAKPESEKTPAALAFGRAVAEASTGAVGFAWSDSALLFTRVYGVVQPFAPLAAMFVPGISDYVDLSKLPPREAITKHLSPITHHQRMDGDLMIIDSEGPIPLNQIAAVFILGAVGQSLQSTFGMPGDAMEPDPSFFIDPSGMPMEENIEEAPAEEEAPALPGVNAEEAVVVEETEAAGMPVE